MATLTLTPRGRYELTRPQAVHTCRTALARVWTRGHNYGAVAKASEVSKANDYQKIISLLSSC